jgi:hypothetical protein
MQASIYQKSVTYLFHIHKYLYFISKNFRRHFDFVPLGYYI